MFGSGKDRGGQPDGERRAALGRVAGGDLPAEPADQTGGQRQPQPAADLADPPVALVQRAPFEGHRQVVVGEAGSAVADLDHAAPAAGPRRPAGPRAPPAPPAVRPAARSPAARPPPAGSAPDRCATGTGVSGISARNGTPTAAHRPAQVDRRRRPAGRGPPAPVPAGSRRPPAGPAPAGRRPAGPGAAPRRASSDRRRPASSGADHPVGERLGVPPDRGQRGAQLVRDGEQELPLPALAGGQRGGQLVQRVRQVGDLVGRLDRHPDRPVAGAQPGGGGRRRAGSAGPADGRAAARPAAPAASPASSGSQRLGSTCRHGPCGRGPGQHHTRRRRAAARPSTRVRSPLTNAAGRHVAPGGDPRSPPAAAGRGGRPARPGSGTRRRPGPAVAGRAGPLVRAALAGRVRPAARRPRAGPGRPAPPGRAVPRRVPPGAPRRSR